MPKPKQNHIKKQSPTTVIGNAAEAAAKEWLLAKGFQFLQAQYQCKVGEIDLIMMDGDEIVFVEVRYRGKSAFSDGLESITRSKCRKLIRTAQYFQWVHPWTDNKPCRFDVISVSGDKLNCKITWIPNAFGIE